MSDCKSKVCCGPTMFDTYGLNIYPVLTNPEIRVDFACPPGWNCNRPNETITIAEGERFTYCDDPRECGPGVPPPTVVKPGDTPTNLCDLLTYTVNQVIGLGTKTLSPRLRVGNDEQTVDCTDFGFEDNGRSVTIPANHVFEPVVAIQLGLGDGETVQDVVCGVAGPVQVNYRFPPMLIDRDTAKARANAAAKEAGKQLFQSKVDSGEFPTCQPCPAGPVTWVVNDNTVAGSAVSGTATTTPFPVTGWPVAASLEMGAYKLRYLRGAIKQRAFTGRPCPCAGDEICEQFLGGGPYCWVWDYSLDGPEVMFQNGRNAAGGYSPQLVDTGLNLTYGELVAEYLGGASGEVFHGGGVVRIGQRPVYDPGAPLQNELHAIPPTVEIVRTRKFLIKAPLPATIQGWSTIKTQLTNLAGITLQTSANPEWNGVFRYGKIEVASSNPVGYTIDDADADVSAINGKSLWKAMIAFVPASGCKWTLEIWGRPSAGGTVLLWQGVLNSLDCRGIYKRSAGAATVPATMTL